MADFKFVKPLGHGGTQSGRGGGYSGGHSGYSGGHSGYSGGHSGRGEAAIGDLRFLYHPEMGFAVGAICYECDELIPITEWFGSEQEAEAAFTGGFVRGDGAGGGDN